ncbi:FMN-binding protein [Undibacterium griseum]|uniref:FMN-binding protein n=1 Tax=Undibacterium griseum TaxID=2762295 RepID=A0ABR6YID8_9BURK|nr:FMN-binding protein [Undibacterium griseum]MBC3883623.1 FMN-binding protein [Undibacterium griseum]
MHPLTPITLTLLAAASSSAFATQYLTAEQAQQTIFPEANRFKPLPLQLSTEQMKQVETLAGLPARSVSWRVTAAYQDEKLLGYVVLDEVIGKFELISYAVGLLPDASVRQIEILAYRESHGFEIRNANWRRQFTGKTAAQGIVVGEGIANISGATLSCTHVTDGVRRIAAIARIALKK